MLRQFRTWRQLGILPYGGTRLGEQPQPLVEAFEVLSQVEKEEDASSNIRLGETLASALAGVTRGA